MMRPHLVRRPLGAVFLVLTLMLALFNSAAPARAEENSAIAVTNLSLVQSTVGGETQDGGIEVGGYAKLSFTWDATDANVKSGDSFSIGLGAHFRNLEFPKTTPMSILYDGAEKQIGSCELTRTRVVCTFDDTVDELRDSGFTSFSGTGQALLVATSSTTSSTADITANGVVTAVELPAGGGITGPDYDRWGSLSKWGGAIAENATSVQWGINFNTTSLTQDTGMVFDGSTNQTLTFTDTLGDGMTFSTDLTKARLLLRNSATDPAREAGDPIVNAAGEDLTDAYGDFDMTMTTEGGTATITVTGPFAPETNYFIVYDAVFPGGNVVKGFQYQNSVTLQGLNQTRSAERYYVDSFTITVEMAAGFGGFDV
ncbi:MAG: peptidase, partial [Propionibacteriaceae bacterium]|nr:peptidase [Propionibacteriaceae bacterium]